jgi:hypothetical protein
LRQRNFHVRNGHTLESVETAKYLGITSSSNMTWSAHISNITSKEIIRIFKKKPPNKE